MSGRRDGWVTCPNDEAANAVMRQLGRESAAFRVQPQADGTTRIRLLTTWERLVLHYLHDQTGNRHRYWLELLGTAASAGAAVTLVAWAVGYWPALGALGALGGAALVIRDDIRGWR